MHQPDTLQVTELLSLEKVSLSWIPEYRGAAPQVHTWLFLLKKKKDNLDVSDPGTRGWMLSSPTAEAKERAGNFVQSSLRWFGTHIFLLGSKTSCRPFTGTTGFGFLWMAAIPLLWTFFFSQPSALIFLWQVLWWRPISFWRWCFLGTGTLRMWKQQHPTASPAKSEQRQRWWLKWAPIFPLQFYHWFLAWLPHRFCQDT